MKNKELQNQIEGMVENCEEEFLDAYQCKDWPVSAQKFAELFLKELKSSLLQLARELDNERWDDE